MPPNPLLQPIVALVLWSLIMWLWMYVTRIPAIAAMNLKLDPNVPPKDLMAQLPARVRWKADNYNHLMEQPTLFYATAFVCALADPGNSTALAAAWTYVGLRVAHSLWQALVNNIPVRFGLFMLSSLALIVLLVQATKAVF
ncbi:MAG: MAPEG family protein [Rhodocyclaceae bacterium]|nr:MAPEG family protein [Rhodocyclaceae bacterium]